MEKLLVLIFTVLLIFAMIRVILLPVRLAWKVCANSLGGLILLWLSNSISWVTGVSIPINPVTASVSGFLGLPGIGLLALIQLIN